MRWVSDAGLYSPKRRESELLGILESLSRFEDVDDFQEDNLELSDLVQKEAFRLDRHEFGEYLRLLYQQLHNFLNSGTEKGLLIAVRATDELIDVHLFRQESGKLTKLVEFVSAALEKLHTFESSHRDQLLSLVSETFGHLIKSGGPVSAQKAGEQIKKMLELLHGEPFQKCIALRMLTELAKNAPAQFNLYLDKFVSQFYQFLFHEEAALRNYALEALNACLGVVRQCATSKRQKWYLHRAHHLMNALSTGSGPEKPFALNALYVVVTNSAGNLHSSFFELADFVFSLMRKNEEGLQDLLIKMIPTLAAMSPQQFYSLYFQLSIDLLRHHLTHQRHERAIMDVIPELMQALAYVIKEASSRVKAFQTPMLAEELERILLDNTSSTILIQTATKCVGCLALVLHEEWKNSAMRLLPLILSREVDRTQIDTAKRILECYPRSFSIIQDHFVAFVELSLVSQTTTLDQKMMIWFILSTFQFELRKGFLKKIENSLDHHLYNYQHPSLRLACAKALENILTTTLAHKSNGDEDLSDLVESFLDHLTTAAVLDVSRKIRFELFSDLLLHCDLHERLSQHSTAFRLAYSLYDESLAIRQNCIQLLGALGRFNFGAIHPSLHGLMVRILQDFKFSGDIATTSKITKESAMMLQILMHSEPRVTKVYLTQIVEKLISKLEMYMSQTTMCRSVKDPTAEAVCSLLHCLMEIAATESRLIEPNLQRIAAIVSTSLRNKSDRRRQILAVKKLGKLCEDFGESFVNFIILPEILNALQDLKNDTSKSSEGVYETEVMDSAIFALSNWDPSFLRLISTSPPTDIAVTINPQDSALMSHAAFPTDELVVGDEVYFNSVAIHALMAALEDARNTDTASIVKCLTSILKLLQKNGASYLQSVLPVFVKIIRQSDDKLRMLLFDQLSDLVRMAGTRASPFCDVLMKLSFQFWNTNSELTVHVINLVSELVFSVDISFETYFHEVVLCLCQVLSNLEDFQLIEPSFQLLQVCGKQIGAYFPVIFPLLLQFVKKVPTSEENIPLHIQHEALKTIRHLLLSIELKQEEKHLLASELFLTLISLLRMEKSLIKDTKETLAVTMCVLGAQVSRVFVKQITNILHDDEDGALLDKVLQRLQDPNTEGTQILTSEEMEMFKPRAVLPRTLSMPGIELVPLDIEQLSRAWDASARSTRDDWEQWIWSLSIEFLRQSSSPALHACYGLAQINPIVAKSFFKFSLLSVWSRLVTEHRLLLQDALESVLITPGLPIDVIQPILDLGEYLKFIEQQEVAVANQLKPLSGLAEKSNAYSRRSNV